MNRPRASDDDETRGSTGEARTKSRNLHLPEVSVPMEPLRRTPPHLVAIERELAAREPIFHHPERGTKRSDFEAMTVDDFWEIGASGRRYSREFVIETLLARFASPHADAYETSEFFTQQLADDLYLLTFTLRQGERVTRRATIWRRVSGDWKIVFHQGTVVED